MATATLHDAAPIAFGVGQAGQGQRGVAGVLDGDPVFHLLAQLGLQLGGGVGRFAFDALLLFGFEAGFAFGFGFDFVGGAREFFARAFGGLGGDVGVDAGAREHVAAAVSWGERRGGRAWVGGWWRARVE